MAKSIFDDKAIEPDAAAIAAALGARHPLWERLLDTLVHEHSDRRTAWAYYKKSTGWLLRVQRKKLTICTLLPTPEDFTVVFLLPERAVVAARAADLPAATLAAMDGASVSRFGHAFNLFVKKEADLDGLAALARIKVESA
jgi:hypothetical protein